MPSNHPSSQNHRSVNLSRRTFLELAAVTGTAACMPSELWAAPNKSDADSATSIDWPKHVEQFPVMTTDAAGDIWMACLERPKQQAVVRVDRVTADGNREPVRFLCLPDATGIGTPAIAGTGAGCIVVFPVERDGKWQIVYAQVAIDQPQSPPQVIPCEGTANISPVVTCTNDQTWVLWESNAGTHRGIYSCNIHGDQPGTPIRISRENVNSYNPSIVAMPDGRLFAAWDAFDGDESNIYGAWCKIGSWSEPFQLTDDVRIERHPHLAVHGDQLWMAWQAQSFQRRGLNNLSEQRIVAARIEMDKQNGNVRLMMPRGLFDRVSLRGRYLVRPQIGFDRNGTLWLAASKASPEKVQAGWNPVLWSYDTDGWSEMQMLNRQEGRWQPVAITFSPDGAPVTASQYDDIPRGWDQTRGIYRDWKSGVSIKQFAAKHLQNQLALEPLAMPSCEGFLLPEKVKQCNAKIPRQTWQTPGGEMLSLYFGDLHDHTDISVCNRRLNPPGHDLYANLRDIEQLDFCATTDHGYNYDPQQWGYNAEQVRQNHDPGRFVTFLAQEWTSSVSAKSGGFGHRNIIFLDPHYPHYHDSFDGPITPREVWDALADIEFICIPHQLADWKGKGRGNPPTDWNFIDEHYQPVAEIFQTRQSYEHLGCPRQAPEGKPAKGNYLQDAWAQGIVIGVIASPDHGGGYGKAGVWAKDLSRESIFEAIRARHTFGTTGTKMALRFSAGDAIMGDKVKRPSGPVQFDIHAVAHDTISEVVIFRNNEIAFQAEPGTTTVELNWTEDAMPDAEHAWYYARIQTADGEIAWTSPIWFVV